MVMKNILWWQSQQYKNHYGTAIGEQDTSHGMLLPNQGLFFDVMSAQIGDQLGGITTTIIEK